MYHPALFRTQLCKRGSFCPFQSICAYAHSLHELRDRSKSEFEDEQKVSVNEREAVRLNVFLPETKERDFFAECGVLWQEQQLKPRALFLPLDEVQAFLLDRSRALFRLVQELAFEEGLGCVAKRLSAQVRDLVIRGIHVEDIRSKVVQALQPPSDYFVLEDKQYSNRVIQSVLDLLQTHGGRQSISSSENVWIEVIATETKVRVHAVNTVDTTGTDLVLQVLERLDFWAQQEGYNEFNECKCCLELYNNDQGIACRNGHFFCSGTDQSCFGLSISSQVNNLRASEASLVCSIYQDPYETQRVAPHLPAAIWQQVQDAIIDKKVEKQSELLAHQFDERLEQKIQELLANYGNTNTVLKERAKKEALKARSTIMNLLCPHCDIAYAEFTGCMALQCQSCGGSFCGYCHQTTTTSRGAHDHVRQCLMNETSNGSYYATEEEIERAQR